jgi:ribosome assembly protein YihI (activator of Der GTPase)
MILLICINELREQQMPREMLDNMSEQYLQMLEQNTELNEYVATLEEERHLSGRKQLADLQVENKN